MASFYKLAGRRALCYAMASMRRLLPLVWLAAFALLLTWRLRPRRSDPSTPAPSSAPAADLPAPARVLVESSRARFSRPDAAGAAPGAVAGAEGVVDTAAGFVEEPALAASRLGLASAAAVASASAPSYALGGAAVAAPVRAVENRGASDAVTPGAGEIRRARRQAGAGAAFDGAASGVPPADTSAALAANRFSAVDRAAAAVEPAAITPGARASAALGLLGALGGGFSSSAGKTPADVKGRPVGGLSSDVAGAGSPGGAPPVGAGVAPAPVTGSPVPGEGEARDESRPVIEAAQAVAGEPRPERTMPSDAFFSSDRGRPPVLPTARVTRDGERGPVVFEADMDIDADGAGGWHRADRTGQSQTSLRYPNGESLNPGTLPFMVVPTDFNRAHPDVRLGDYGVISYRGKSVYAIVGDRGPAGVLGEASISAAVSLGINPDPNRGGVDSGVRYAIFPGTADRTPPRDARSIQVRGAQLSQQLGLPLR